MLEKAERTADPTRARILDAALDLFGERGLTGTTVRDIAKRAGVNVAAISYHFGGKDELYRAVADTVTGEMETRLRARMGKLLDRMPRDADEALATLETFVTTIVDVIVGPPEMRRVARFIIREQMQPTAAFPILFGVLSRMHVASCRLFAAATRADAESEETRMRVFMMIGQVVFLRIAEPAILTRLGLQSYDEAFLDRTKALVRQNVRAMVLTAREAAR